MTPEAKAGLSSALVAIMTRRHPHWRWEVVWPDDPEYTRPRKLRSTTSPTDVDSLAGRGAGAGSSGAAKEYAVDGGAK